MHYAVFISKLHPAKQLSICVMAHVLELFVLFADVSVELCVGCSGESQQQDETETSLEKNQ